MPPIACVAVALYVQKFGGTSVGTPDRIREVADHAARCVKRGDQVVLVVSAMGKETDELLRLADDVSTSKPGREMDMPEMIVARQPFPGPGLGIRVIGEVTEDKLAILREADYVYRDEIAKNGLDKEIWQYFAVLTGIRTVGVMGDERTYNYTIGLRAVTSSDGMTADWARIPLDVLEKISTRIVNEVKHVNRIVYDITSKPPATIEWE